MDTVSKWVTQAERLGNGIPLETAALSLLVAFILGQVSAWVYMMTHSGLSYSRAFVQSIVLLTLIVALIMMIIGSNIIVAFGMIGALAVIRFRNILKDTRDTSFIFFALAQGMAIGTGNYAMAILGSLAFCGTVIYLHAVGFGSLHVSDGFIRVQLLTGPASPRLPMEAALNRFCRSRRLISERYVEEGASEIAYRLSMKDPHRANDLVNEISHLEGIAHVTFVSHEEEGEV